MFCDVIGCGGVVQASVKRFEMLDSSNVSHVLFDDLKRHHATRLKCAHKGVQEIHLEPWRFARC